MDWLQFTSSIVGHLAWPAVVAWSVWLLRAPLVKLVPGLRTLKVAGVHAEFGALIDAAKEGTAELRPIPHDQRPAIPAELTAIRTKYEPVLAVQEAWSHVEHGLREIAESKSVTGWHNVTQLIRYLRQAGVIDEAMAKLADDLHIARNLAAHAAHAEEITDQQASDYVDAAARLLENLGWIVEKHEPLPK